MVRILFVLLFVCNVFAANLQENVRNLIGDDIYNANFDKIQNIFSNSNEYTDIYGNLDYRKITEILINYSFLNLEMDYVATMRLNFESDAKPLLLVKIVSQALKDMGYVYFKSVGFDMAGGKTRWSVTVASKSMVNSGQLYETLLKNSAFIKNISKTSESEFVYMLDLDNAYLITERLPKSKDEFIKPIEAFFYKINDKSTLAIQSHRQNNWRPIIKIFDKNLDLIKQLKEDKKTNFVNFELPKNAYYIRISDIYTLENIKYGLIIDIN